MFKMSLDTILKHQRSDSGAQTEMSGAILDPLEYQAWPSAAAGPPGPASPWRSLRYLRRSEMALDTGVQGSESQPQCCTY